MAAEERPAVGALDTVTRKTGGIADVAESFEQGGEPGSMLPQAGGIEASGWFACDAVDVARTWGANSSLGAVLLESAPGTAAEEPPLPRTAATAA